MRPFCIMFLLAVVSTACVNTSDTGDTADTTIGAVAEHERFVPVHTGPAIGRISGVHLPRGVDPDTDGDDSDDGSEDTGTDTRDPGPSTPSAPCPWWQNPCSPD